MIYLDNAATTMRKPPQDSAGCGESTGINRNAGRGAYHASLDASPDHL